METPPCLFDRKTILRNRKRVTQKQSENFLFRELAHEFKERLADSNRVFTRPAIVTGFPEFWKKWMPNAKIVTDEEFLNLTLDNYDLIIHALCLHWSNDPVGQLIQCNRALKSDGFFMCSLLGGNTLSELKHVLSEAELTISNGLSDRLSPMAEIRSIGNLLQRAGFALPVADSVKHNVVYDSIYHLMRDLRDMGETNALSSRNKRFTRSKLFEEANRVYLKKYKLQNNKIMATFELIFLAGWSPDDSQPNPLKPGTPAKPLGEVLNHFELHSDKNKEI
ncbi:MAG: SAM-dependent methyltransferase [Rhodobacteraceae bacterium]|jgi:SAM-dependent methyltransferase|nr:SAM-dependent methyltransferase [Paracoccaceae bacterium]MBT4778417.1 SAM-dependent methyltransferase [Paracoccaceae bacterium]MDG2372728.1 SAM-dependent methyltransferase [Paracoccaceae bacterium]|tara:strand:+ start:8773 stop:9609 length:837 start_codon:yes stop_codon:yes gene_type:complete